MPDRRFALAAQLAADGLPPPSDETLDALRDIVDEGVLGASNHAELALALIASIAAEGPMPPISVASALATAAFIAETRGAAAPIVANAIAWQRRGLAIEDTDGAAITLAQRAEEWSVRSAGRRQALVDHAVSHLAAAASPLIFDYSSTVADVVRAMCKAGRIDRIIVPESRAIDGGRRYVEALGEAGVPIRFLPDAAIEYGVAMADCALLGAERITQAGGVVNTIGSLSVARAAKAHDVPVYGAADLFKVDLEDGDANGDFPLRSYPAIAGSLTVSVSTEAPELELARPEMITAILTEAGPIAPGDIASAAVRIIAASE